MAWQGLTILCETTLPGARKSWALCCRPLCMNFSICNENDLFLHCQERYSHNIAFYSLDESIVDYITFAIFSLVIRRNSQLLIGPFLRLCKTRNQVRFGNFQRQTWIVVPEGQDVSWLCEDSMEDPPPDTGQKHL